LLYLFPLSFRVLRRRLFTLLDEFFLLLLLLSYLFCFLLLFRDGFVARGEQLLGGLFPFAVQVLRGVLVLWVVGIVVCARSLRRVHHFLKTRTRFFLRVSKKSEERKLQPLCVKKVCISRVSLKTYRRIYKDRNIVNNGSSNKK